MEFLKNAGLVILGGLGWLLMEALAQIALDLMAGLGWVAVRGAPRRASAHPALLIMGWGVVGLLGGIATLLVQPERFTPPAPSALG